MRYTTEQKLFIKEHAPGKYNAELAELFYQKFGIVVSVSQINSFKKNYKIKSNVPRNRVTGNEGLFTKEQKDFIKRNVKGKLNEELAGLVNQTFDLQITAKQINTYKKNRGLTSGRDCRFQKGCTPANKGLKGICNVGGNNSSFKKGHRPYNYMPVGSERVNSYDYVDIKIADPNKWCGKHLIIWEQHHEKPIPKGYVVVFGDGNRRNFDPENLLLVSRSQLAIMNKRNLVKTNTEFTKSGILIAKIIEKIGQRKRKRAKS